MRALFLLALLGPSAGAADAPDFRRSAERQARIEAAIMKAGSRHPWAGRYYQGDGLGMNESLLLSPSGEYSFETSGCTSFPPAQDGKVREKNGVLLFEGADTNEMTGRRYHIVPWGERVYLISENGLIGFANDVNQGWEPRYRSHGFHFMRQGGGEIQLASGRPRVPKSIEPYLLDHVVDTLIVSAGASVELSTESHLDGEIETSIVIDAGASAGLLPGMELKLRGRIDGEAIISRVDAGSSTAILVSTTPPQAGWRLSTRFDWRRELAPPDQPYRVRVTTAAGSGRSPYKGRVERLDDLVPLEDAPRFGFRVSEVARVEVGAVSDGLSSWTKLGEVLGPLGANAFVLDRNVEKDPPGPWSHVTKAVGYRVEFEGRPVPDEDFATNLRVADLDNTWERTRARILMKRSKYAREELRLEEEVTLEFLHLTERQWHDSYTLKVDDLSPEQRAAVKKRTGVTYPYVTLNDVLYSSLSKWTKTRDAEVRLRLEELGKSDRKGYGEYEALRAVAHPRVYDVESTWPEEPEEARLLDEIENAGPEHPWAGEYGEGDGFSSAGLILGPSGRYFFKRGSDIGSARPVLGTFVEENGIIRLRSADTAFLRDEYHLVTWGKRVYLIADDEMVRFANYVNVGWEPGYGHQSFYRRSGGDSASGRPGIPPQFAAYFLDRAVDANVVSVGSAPAAALEPMGHDESAFLVTIEPGARDGMFAGMRLFGQGRDGVATVLTVAQASATAKVVSNEAPAPGMKLSSREDGHRELPPPEEPYRVNVDLIGARRPPLPANAQIVDVVIVSTEAEREGFRVIEIASADIVTVSPELNGLDDRAAFSAGALGANVVRFEDYGYDRTNPKQDSRWPYTRHASFYRVELEGKPLPAGRIEVEQFAEMEYRVNWAYTRANHRLAETPYARELARAKRDAECAELRLDAEKCVRWDTLRVEDLTRGQRALFWETRETRGRRGLVRDFNNGYVRHRSEEFPRSIEERMRAFALANSGAYDEYQRLSAEASRSRWLDTSPRRP